MINFRSRKDHGEIDCSFFANDGPNPDDMSKYLIGDKVTLVFGVPQKVIDAVNENLSSRSGVRIITGFGNKNPAVHIPFRVVDRRHALSWKKVGNLRSLGSSIVLEAENGYWEDVFLWVCCDKTPQWATYKAN